MIYIINTTGLPASEIKCPVLQGKKTQRLQVWWAPILPRFWRVALKIWKMKDVVKHSTGEDRSSCNHMRVEYDTFPNTPLNVQLPYNPLLKTKLICSMITFPPGSLSRIKTYC